MPPIYIAYLNRLDIEELKITDAEILSAIEMSLAAQGRGDAVIAPRVHLEPGAALECEPVAELGSAHHLELADEVALEEEPVHVLREAADRPGRRQDCRRLRRQLQIRSSFGARDPCSV